MSWLYSVIFAGLLLSGGDNESQNAAVPVMVETQTASPVSDETEKFEQSYPISANGRVSVSNVNGSIVIEAWDKNEVKLEATKIADSKETLSEVELVIESRADSFSVETDYKGWKYKDRNNRDKYRRLEVQFRLWVPRTAELNEIETVNGSVAVSNFVKYTKVSAVNGGVVATNLRGTACLSTVNGEVKADFERLESGSKIDLSTVNGRVSLSLPSDANATIKADSLNGNIANDFGLPVRKGEYVGRDLYGRVGSGDVQIKLNSVNGTLSIARKNDGKTVNPSVNMLPPKGEADTDEESAVSASSKTAKINKTISRSVRESEKRVTEAMKETAAAIAVAAEATRNIDLERLAKIDVKINTKEIEARVNEGIARSTEALARLNDANWILGTPVVEKKTNSFSIKGTPKVMIDAMGCGVRVRGWDQPEVKYILTEIATNRNRTPPVVTEDKTDSSVNINVVVDYESRNSRFYESAKRYRLEVFVPRKSNLRIVTDGEIRLSGVSGELELDGEDGAIDVRDVEGKLNLQASDGQVRIIGFKGELLSETVDGDVFLEGDFLKLNAKAVDGKITLTLPESSDATISSNTKVYSEGLQVVREKEETWRIGKGGKRFDFEFVDGNLLVRSGSSISTY